MIKICLLLIVVLAGCSSTQAIHKNYKEMVRLEDGVNAQEAKIIAQKKLINTVQKRDYRISLPDIKTTPEAFKYPDYWFIVFGHNWFSPISKDPMAKTYTELRETQFLVVIEKATGKTKFLGEWHSKRANNFDWVFNPEAYRKKDPLALPPGEPAKELF